MGTTLSRRLFSFTSFDWFFPSSICFDLGFPLREVHHVFIPSTYKCLHTFFANHLHLTSMSVNLWSNAILLLASSGLADNHPKSPRTAPLGDLPWAPKDNLHTTLCFTCGCFWPSDLKQKPAFLNVKLSIIKLYFWVYTSVTAPLCGQLLSTLWQWCPSLIHRRRRLYFSVCSAPILCVCTGSLLVYLNFFLISSVWP